MLGKVMARTLALSKGMSLEAHIRPVTRLGVHCFGTTGADPDMQVLIDTRLLSRSEHRRLQAWCAPVYITEIYRKQDGRLMDTKSPYSQFPSCLTWASDLTIQSEVPIFHFHGRFRWTIPAAVLDIRAEDIPREQAFRLCLEEIAQSNHQRFALRGLVEV